MKATRGYRCLGFFAACLLATLTSPCWGIDSDALTRLGRAIGDSKLLGDEDASRRAKREVFATSSVASVADGPGFGFAEDAREKNREIIDRIHERQSSIGDMRSRMSDNQSRLADMRSRMGDNQSRLADMRSRMGDNQSRLADMRSRMGDNQSRLADMRSRMGDNQSRLADMRSRMGDNQSRLADMRSRMSDRMSRQSELTMLRGYNMQIRQSDFNSLHRQDYVKEVFHQTKDLFRGGPDLARDSLIEKRTAQLDTKFGNLQRNMPQFQSKIRFGSEIPRIKELGRQSTYVWAPKSAGNARETFQNIARGAGRMFKESSRLTAYAAVGTLQGALGHFEHAREVRDGYLKTTAEAFKISSPSLERGHYSLHVETINGIRSVNGTMKLQDATYRIQTFNGVQSISRINTGTVGRR